MGLADLFKSRERKELESMLHLVEINCAIKDGIARCNDQIEALEKGQKDAWEKALTYLADDRRMDAARLLQRYKALGVLISKLKHCKSITLDHLDKINNNKISYMIFVDPQTDCVDREYCELLKKTIDSIDDEIGKIAKEWPKTWDNVRGLITSGQRKEAARMLQVCKAQGEIFHELSQMRTSLQNDLLESCSPSQKDLVHDRDIDPDTFSEKMAAEMLAAEEMLSAEEKQQFLVNDIPAADKDMDTAGGERRNSQNE